MLDSDDLLVRKEYVKGRGNVYANPAVAEYNKTTDSANKTVATLMKILKNFNVPANDKEDESDPLMRILNGDVDESL